MLFVYVYVAHIFVSSLRFVPGHDRCELWNIFMDMFMSAFKPDPSHRLSYYIMLEIILSLPFQNILVHTSLC